MGDEHRDARDKWRRERLIQTRDAISWNAPPVTGRGYGSLCFWRPDGAPAGIFDELAGEDLAGPPLIAVVPLNQRTVCAILIRGGICPGCGVDGACVVRVLEGLRNRIAFLDPRHVLRFGVFAGADHQTSCRDGGQLHELTSCDLAQGNLLNIFETGALISQGDAYLNRNSGHSETVIW